MKYDVIIIGAGLSGISAGLRLAHFGKKVRIFERHRLPGGLNSYYYRKDGVVNVGLHAMTNYAPAGDRTAPLNKLLRQLRLKREQLCLMPQTFSLISFPGMELHLENDLEKLKQEVAVKFPEDAEGFRRLCDRILAFDSMSMTLNPVSAKEILKEYLSSSLLREMLCCAMMFYGNPDVEDMDFNQFCIIFRSLCVEGIARPLHGMKGIIDDLVARFEEDGGVLSLGNGVSRIRKEDGKVIGIIDDKGEEHEAEVYLSCAGAVETELLCDSAPAVRQGRLPFVEIILKLNCHPAELGLKACIIFQNDTGTFRFVPVSSGVSQESMLLCMPGNYQGSAEIPEAHTVRVSFVTATGWWEGLPSKEYREAKEAVVAQALERVERLAPGLKAALQSWEMFTPRTITRYTGHVNGVIYGSPDKNRLGTTSCSNLYLCGADQGFLGIVGALLSGTIIANRYVLT